MIAMRRSKTEINKSNSMPSLSPSLSWRSRVLWLLGWLTLLSFLLLRSFEAYNAAAFATETPDAETKRASAKPAKPATPAFMRPLDCREPMQRLVDTMVPGVLPIDPSSVAVLSAFLGPRAMRLHNLASSNRREYAAMHGYQYVEATSKGYEGPGRVLAVSDPRLRLGSDWDKPNSYWCKLHLIRSVAAHMPEVRYVLWMDADIVLTNFAVSMDFLLAQNKSMVVSGDHGGVNTGLFLMRLDARSLRNLDRVFKVDPRPGMWPGEQGAMYITSMDPDAERWPHSHWSVFMRAERKRGNANHLLQADVDGHIERMQAGGSQDLLQLVNGTQHLIELPRHELWLPMCVFGNNNYTWTKGAFDMHSAGGGSTKKLAHMKLFAESNVVHGEERYVQRVPLMGKAGVEVLVALPLSHLFD